MNSYGTLFKISTFGESHGAAIGVIIDGCPSGLSIDEHFIQSELDRRKPGQSKITTQRKEDDTFKILSGVFEGKSTGAPIPLLLKTVINEVRITVILKIHFAHHMQIIHIRLSMVFGIIEEVVEVQHAKQQHVWQQEPLLNLY